VGSSCLVSLFPRCNNGTGRGVRLTTPCLVHPDRGFTRLGDLHGEGVEGLRSWHGADGGCADPFHDFLDGFAHGVAVLLALLIGHLLHGTDDLGDATATESCEVECHRE